MPSDMINKVVKKCDKSKEDVEQLGEDAKEQAKEQGEEENYAYITGIFKQMLGDECINKLGGEKNEETSSPFREYLLSEMHGFGGGMSAAVSKKVDTCCKEAKKSMDEVKKALMNSDTETFKFQKKNVQDKMRELQKIHDTLYK